MAKNVKSQLGKSKVASLRSSTPNVRAKSGSSPHVTQSHPKSERIISFTLDPNNPPKLTRRDVLPRTKAESAAAAKSDPDNQPLTEAALKEFKRAVPPPDAKAIRKATGLSQLEFAWRYGFDVTAVRDWEQGRRTPDRAARVLLAIIKYEPRAVERALAAYAMSPYGKRGDRQN